MQLIVFNPSSPGASFTRNTNDVILKTGEWINEHNGEVIPFVDFRHRLERDKNVNDNNNRNIFPLLKNAGFVNYEAGSDLAVNKFFTARGHAYTNVLKMIESIRNNDQYSAKQKKVAIENAEDALSHMIVWGLKNIVNNSELNYSLPLKDTICYLIRYMKISREEYALLLSTNNSQSIKTRLDEIKEYIQQYRNNEINLDVKVEVRNDIDIREQTNQNSRKEGAEFLTSYNYYIGLLKQAKLVERNGEYYEVNEDRIADLFELGGISE